MVTALGPSPRWGSCDKPGQSPRLSPKGHREPQHVTGTLVSVEAPGQLVWGGSVLGGAGMPWPYIDARMPARGSPPPWAGGGLCRGRAGLARGCPDPHQEQLTSGLGARDVSGGRWEKPESSRAHLVLLLPFV